MNYKRNLLIAILAVGLALILQRNYFLTSAARTLALQSLAPLSLDGYSRLLILAPHCDDETLGSAGLIQAAIQAGMQVKVGIATNGDGYLFATMEDFRRIYPHAKDFIRMGTLRQQESLAAMQVLGVSASQVVFLSFPDRGTPQLWNGHWFASNPFKSPFSQADRSPYPITYNPKSVYAGEDYLADIRAIINDYRPDLVIYPHPEDVHPDHWGLSNFTRLAIALIEKNDPAYHPRMMAYLVHRPDFPLPRGHNLQEPLLPPPRLFSLDANWLRFDLSLADVSLKDQAVAQYRSQLPLLRGLMESFVRVNELYADLEPATISYLSAGDPLNPESWQDTQGNPILPVQKDPVGDFITRQLVPPSDLLAVFAAQTDTGTMQICGQLRGMAQKTLIYTIQVRAIGVDQVVYAVARSHGMKPGELQAQTVGRFVCAEFSSSIIGNPWLVFMVAETSDRFTGILDQTAWQAVYSLP
jgi:LmbE family N-acetylglucosaminyl deacetylase